MKSPTNKNDFTVYISETRLQLAVESNNANTTSHAYCNQSTDLSYFTKKYGQKTFLRKKGIMKTFINDHITV